MAGDPRPLIVGIARTVACGHVLAPHAIDWSGWVTQNARTGSVRPRSLAGEGRGPVRRVGFLCLPGDPVTRNGSHHEEPHATLRARVVVPGPAPSAHARGGPVRRIGDGRAGGWPVLLLVLLPARLSRRRLAHAVIVQRRALQANRVD